MQGMICIIAASLIAGISFKKGLVRGEKQKEQKFAALKMKIRKDIVNIERGLIDKNSDRKSSEFGKLDNFVIRIKLLKNDIEIL